jgi:(S)-3,5-dihydroxyphenylglycine transaminase
MAVRHIDGARVRPERNNSIANTPAGSEPPQARSAATARGRRRKLLTLADVTEAAQSLTAPVSWDFVAGGAGEERTLAANTAAFDQIWLLPRVLSGVQTPSSTVQVLGRTWSAPLGVAPTAYHTLMHPDGELATARAASSIGVPLCVSTFAGRTLADIAAVASCPLWLQIYWLRDRSATRRLIEDAAAAGFEALVLTVDAPHLGRRLRDLRNDFQLPAGIAPANLTGNGFSSPAGHARTEFDAALDWSVLGWLREVSALPVLLKGIMNPEDATRAAELGVDGIIVSNHGGRQLDGAAATLEVLSDIAAAVAGRCAVLVDGGVRRGRDILACLALGADAVLLGRPILEGLAVGGQAGVECVLRIVIDELLDAMQLTGTPWATDVPAGVIRSGPPRLAPNPQRPSAVPMVRVR